MPCAFCSNMLRLFGKGYAVEALQELAGRLDFIQNNALRKLSDSLDQAQTSHDRANIADLVRLLEVDISTRTTIRDLSRLLDSSEIPADAYARFMYASGSAIAAMDQCHVPLDLLGAFRTITTAVGSAQRLSVADIFTVISVIITAAALCLSQLHTGPGRDVIIRLDQLLEIKSQQLKQLF